MARSDVRATLMARLGDPQVSAAVEAYRLLHKVRAAQFRPRDRLNPDMTWRVLGMVEATEPLADGLRFICEAGTADLRWLAADCLSVSARFNLQTGSNQPPSYAVSQLNWPPVRREVRDGLDAVEIHCGELVYRIGKRPFRIGIEASGGRLICLDASGMQYRADGAVGLAMKLHPQERGYGLGDRDGTLDLRRRVFPLWNRPPIYSIPFYLGAHAHGYYGVFWDNTWRGQVDLGSARGDELRFEAEGGQLRYYLFAGADIQNILARYTELTGRTPLPPLWALGYHQGAGVDTDALRRAAAALRGHDIPCDVLHLGLDFSESLKAGHSSLELVTRLSQKLNHLGIRLTAALAPGLPIEQAQAVGTDHFLRLPDGEPFTAPGWGGMSCLLDFTGEGPRRWWRNHVSTLLKAGVAGFVHEMSEPVIFTMDGIDVPPDYVRHDEAGQGGDHRSLHNLYGLLMAAETAAAQDEVCPQNRAFSATYSGFTSVGRCTSAFLAVADDWDALRGSMRRALGMSLSGVSLFGLDFEATARCEPELFTRWLQAACLLPMIRAQSTADGMWPWDYSRPYSTINQMTLHLRYRFLPYLYAVIAQARAYGRPTVRTLWMADPDNPALRNIDHAYLLGDSVLVAPVLEPDTLQRPVYLPQGVWYDYWTNEALEGGQVIRAVAPLERLPLFIRAGTVLPQWPDARTTGEGVGEQLWQRVYPGDGETVLYEDDGEGKSYLDGNYRWVYITCRQDEDTLWIDRRAAGSYDPPYKSMRLEIVGYNEEPASIRVDRKGAPLWFYDDDLIELTVNQYKSIEIVKKPTTADRTIVHRPW